VPLGTGDRKRLCSGDRGGSQPLEEPARVLEEATQSSPSVERNGDAEPLPPIGPVGAEALQIMSEGEGTINGERAEPRGGALLNEPDGSLGKAPHRSRMALRRIAK
jgi:hypothetical protein